MNNEIKTWQERFNIGMGTIEFCTTQEIAELRAKVESLAADAERYKKLRNAAYLSFDFDITKRGIDLDVQVDTMAKEKA